MKSVTAVIVTYQSEKVISDCLSSLFCSYELGLLDVIVVDNGSIDGTRAILDNNRSWLKHIVFGQNCGFGQGCNIGFSLVSTPFVLFINPDAAIPSADLRTLTEFLESYSKAGVCGPAIVESDKTLQATSELPSLGSIIGRHVPFIRRNFASVEIQPGEQPRKTGWVCGAVLLVRSDLMRKIGGFDPRFFLYWEEFDLCRRVADTGYEVWTCGTAVAAHIGGASVSADDRKIHGCIARHYYQSRFYYMSKHFGYFAAALVDIMDLLLIGLKTVVDIMRGRGISRIYPRLEVMPLKSPKLYDC